MTNLDQLTVSRNNQLVQSSYELSLDESRVMELAIAKIKFGEDAPATIDITAHEYGKVFSIDSSNVYRQLNKAAERLYERSIELLNFKGEESKRKFRIVQMCDYFPAEGKISLSFSDGIRPYLKIMKEKGNYTTYRLHQTKMLSSAHSIRLFGLLMQVKTIGKINISLEDLKQAFAVQDKYSTWGAFERRVIKPSVEALTEQTNYEVKYKAIKKGRPVVSIEFTFKVKDQLSFDYYNESQLNA
jgi:plasmid replication initiation protein|tara:strand:- start:44 stop:772 length:729 start_codon:yes stop_codon:yes gene_type:complete